jgi:hypothetical protein
MAELGSLQFAGYHGTSIGNARNIEQSGFRQDTGTICFAPMDNIFFAQSHGRRRAQELGDATFGVVLANFPPHPLELGLSGDQINVPAARVGDIVVRKVLEFETLSSGLIVPSTENPC